MTLDDHKHPKHKQYQRNVFNIEETVTKKTSEIIQSKSNTSKEQKQFFFKFQTD